ncbi:MAG: hypothetical protein IPJ40_13350 [Saprospirales bacterium]|nr:hypothetical protein [Saprospirales bacterium]
MKFKGHEFTGINQMINEENDMRIRAAWDNSLRHQIPKKILSIYPDFILLRMRSYLQTYFPEVDQFLPVQMQRVYGCPPG